MKAKGWAVVAVLGLAGCSMDISPAHIRAAERMCATFGGVGRIPAQSKPANRLLVICADGTRIIGDVTITAEEAKE